MLKNKVFGYDTANHGREALDMTQARDYDLILMDMQMPEMDGIEATLALRAREQETGAKRVPIVAMTANALSEDREQCQAAGMDDHLAKPVEMDKLAAVMRQWLAA